jgi:hypothetical protein
MLAFGPIHPGFRILSFIGGVAAIIGTVWVIRRNLRRGWLRAVRAQPKKALLAFLVLAAGLIAAFALLSSIPDAKKDPNKSDYCRAHPSENKCTPFGTGIGLVALWLRVADGPPQGEQMTGRRA